MRLRRGIRIFRVSRPCDGGRETVERERDRESEREKTERERRQRERGREREKERLESGAEKWATLEIKGGRSARAAYTKERERLAPLSKCGAAASRGENSWGE